MNAYFTIKHQLNHTIFAQFEKVNPELTLKEIVVQKEQSTKRTHDVIEGKKKTFRKPRVSWVNPVSVFAAKRTELMQIDSFY